MLSQRNKIAIRRHLGIPFAGTAQAGRLFGWRFEIHVEDLEYKLNNMQPAEEQLITGRSMGSWRLDGVPTAGDVITYTLNDGVNAPQTIHYTVTSQDIAFQQPGNPRTAATYSIALNSALALNAALSQYGYACVGVNPADELSPAYVPPYFAEIVITGPSTSTFTLGGSVAGTTNLNVEDQGLQCPVVADFVSSVTGVAVTKYGYVAVLDYLAMGMSQQFLSLWLKQADVATFQPAELRQRSNLYRTYIAMLSRDMGGKQYVRKFGGGGARGGVA